MTAYPIISGLGTEIVPKGDMPMAAEMGDCISNVPHHPRKVGLKYLGFDIARATPERNGKCFGKRFLPTTSADLQVVRQRFLICRFQSTYIQLIGPCELLVARKAVCSATGGHIK